MLYLLYTAVSVVRSSDCIHYQHHTQQCFMAQMECCKTSLNGSITFINWTAVAAKFIV